MFKDNLETLDIQGILKSFLKEIETNETVKNIINQSLKNILTSKSKG